jgi:hypothetical protein
LDALFRYMSDSAFDVHECRDDPKKAVPIALSSSHTQA